LEKETFFDLIIFEYHLNFTIIKDVTLALAHHSLTKSHSFAIMNVTLSIALAKERFWWRQLQFPDNMEVVVAKSYFV